MGKQNKRVSSNPKQGKPEPLSERKLPPVDYTPPTPPVKPPKKEK